MSGVVLRLFSGDATHAESEKGWGRQKIREEAGRERLCLEQCRT